MLTRTIEALDRLNRVLSDENIKTFSATLSDTEAFTREMRDRKTVIADAQKALQDADVAIQQVTQLSKSSQDLVDGEGKRSLKNIADAAEETKSTAHEVSTLIEKLQGPATDFANTGLPQVTAAVIQLRTAAEALERLVNEIQSSPTGALGKAPAEDVKVKP